MGTKTKTNTEPATEMEAVAMEYQTLDREIKALLAKQKPLKDTLVNHAKENKVKFDEAFQYKFSNGTFIVMRVKDTIIGTEKAKTELMKYDEGFVDKKLNEKAVLEAAPLDDRLRKTLTRLGLSISQKESFAVYAG